MKKLMIIVTMLTLALAFTACSDDGDYDVRIGVLQSIDHGSLDAAREGFIAGMADFGYVDGENLSFSFYNAQGDIANAQTMAQRIVDAEPDLILGIATSTSQALANATDTIPIVVTAVTSPYSAGLVETYERPNTNVTGTSDMAPVERQFELLNQLLPDATTVGIIWNSSEVNSVIQANMAMEYARALGLRYIVTTVTSTADVAQALESIIGQIDVLYTPADNTIAASLPTVVRIADEFDVPIIGANRNHVNHGALATIGIDYYLLGRQAAAMAVQILRGEAIPQEMPIQWQEENFLAINTNAAARLGVEVPQALLDEAVLVED